MLPSRDLWIPIGAGWTAKDKQSVDVNPMRRDAVSPNNTLARCVQWWDANQQVNRPHGWAFSKISNGVIRDMKLWKVV